MDCTTANVELDVSRESGEITDIEELDEPEADAKSTSSSNEGDYNRFAFYVAQNWEGRLVLDSPPAPVPRCMNPLPVSRATIITDRVGRNLTAKDRVIYMQNDVTQDL